MQELCKSKISSVSMPCPAYCLLESEFLHTGQKTVAYLQLHENSSRDYNCRVFVIYRIQTNYAKYLHKFSLLLNDTEFVDLIILNWVLVVLSHSVQKRLQQQSFACINCLKFTIPLAHCTRMTPDDGNNKCMTLGVNTMNGYCFLSNPC